MSEIAKVDSNFTVEKKLHKKDIRFYRIDEAPIAIHGIFKENGKYRRMPAEVARKVSEGVYALHTNTAGGRVRFRTDSPFLAIRAKMDGVCKMPHMPLSGSAGFDVYDGKTYMFTYVPPSSLQDDYEGIFNFGREWKKEVTINFPLYSDVKELYIGLQEDATLEKATPYKNEKPIVYYGSSITQGGCASRPGMSYQAIVSRMLSCDYINLGFSGSAKAEDEMIDYIKNLNMSVFVYDYDHNAPSVEHLAATHEKMFLALRKAQPLLPVIMMPRPKHLLAQEDKVRRSIVEKTYQNAMARGDKNVYFIDGAALTALCKEEGTVDNIHPTDFGFASMAKAVSEVLSGLI